MSSSPREQQWQDGAGGLLLLAAANATDLLSQLEGALPMKQQQATAQEPAPQRPFYPHLRLLLTLLFLNAVGREPTLGLTHLHGKRTGEAFGKAAALQLSSRRTLSQDIGDRQC